MLQTNKIAVIRSTGLSIIEYECPLCGKQIRRTVDVKYVRSKNTLPCSYCKVLLRVE